MAPRTEYGFERTACACRRCTINCEHIPGALAPPDLQRMTLHFGCEDVLAFAREHLLASEGVAVNTGDGKRIPLPTLVPASVQPSGHCKFFQAGRCTIHPVSPYGCAFIDAHLSDHEYALRADALYRDLHAQWQSNGLYAQVWRDLQMRGLVAAPLESRQYRLNKALRREKLA